jgi:hypothetical protein
MVSVVVVAVCQWSPMVLSYNINNFNTYSHFIRFIRPQACRRPTSRTPDGLR